MPARDFPPRLMPAPLAAHYLGMSVSKLRTLGLHRKEHGGNRLYDKADLDAFADSLPYEAPQGGDSGEENTCDSLFGAGS